MPETNSPINITPSEAKAGLDLNSSLSSIKPGFITYALNAVTSNSTGNSINYQNESGNSLYSTFPDGYKVNGKHVIFEANLSVFWLVNGDLSEIGTVSDGVYSKYINDSCLALDENYPIHKAFHKITPLGIEVYWTDAKNNRRYINLSKPPYRETPDPNGCGVIIHDDIDCNKLNVQPNFNIPQIEVTEVDTGGNITAGTYQFAIQYASADSEPYTSFYSITDPLPIGNTRLINPAFDYKTGSSIKVNISNIDTSGVYKFINVAVIKTINLITSQELVGTYRIDENNLSFVYNGEKEDNIRLSIDDIFQKYPIYEKADDIFLTGDILGWAGVTTNERINYQSIWNKVDLKWQTYRIPSSEGYNKELTSEKRKGYFRDEVYAIEGCFLLRNGYQTDKCHIPGRLSNPSDTILIENNIKKGNKCDVNEKLDVPKWKLYNTATTLGYSSEWINDSNKNNCYNGPYQYGDFAYYESSEKYPCDEKLWGELAGENIRFHKMPDSVATHIHDDQGNIYPLGIKVDIQQIVNLIKQSNLTESQKNDIVGFKILRADRINNKSVIARGLINNVLKYTTSDDSTSTSVLDSANANLLKLIEDTITMIGRAKTSLGGARFEAKKELNQAIDYLDEAKKLPFDSDIFRAKVNQAKSKIIDVSERSGLDNKSTGLIDAASQLVDSILEVSGVLIDVANAIGEDTLINENNYYFPNYLYNDVTGNDPFLNNIIVDDSSKQRFSFHSPDTSFYQPYLGNILKLETVETGVSEGHIVEVKNHSKYQFLSTTAYLTASISGLLVGFSSGQYGVSTKPFDGVAAFTAYKTILDILYKVSPFRNFCYQYNSVGNYSKYSIVPNSENKQRNIDIASYLVPGIQSASDNLLINNYQRESSVYIKTTDGLPYSNEQDPNGTIDNSKFLVPTYTILPSNISSYYATIKKDIENQYGQIYSYDSIDTGFQTIIDIESNTNGIGYVFGGDCFINKFAYKSKIPFFTDNRVGFPDESDIFYDEIGNVGKPKYWFSTDVTSHNSFFGSVFGVKPHKFFWQRNSAFTDYGNIFLFAYGIPYFYCESEVNVDFRQAFNDKEGDFYPRVSTGIPDDWLQEKNVSIQQDNTYFYNKTYSKQNKENYFSSIPPDYTDADKRQYLSHSAIYSDPQKEIVDYKHNNWLLYKPVSRFDFPKSYGKLISVDGVWNKQVLVRYENFAELYNALTTINTSSSKAAYLGNSELFKSSPPIDFALTETGYGGGWNKMMIKTEIGFFLADLKRGNILLLERGLSMKNISGNLSSFFSKELKFYIKNKFPDFPVDNSFKDIGLTGTYDNYLKRVLITKRDYKCIDNSIVYKDNKLYKNNIEVNLEDERYFVNKSFTISYSMDIQNYASFHSYIPNYYIPSLDGFYSGNKENSSTLWSHFSNNCLLNNFYNKIEPYIIEYPYSYKFQDEILQSIKDYSRAYLYDEDNETYIKIDDVFFNQAILYSDEACSGVLELVPKPKASLSEYMKYPKYYNDKKAIIYTKSDNFYNYNTFWSMIKDKNKAIFIPSKEPSMFKELNQNNMNYSKMSFGKAPLRSKNLKVRHILNNTSDYKIISEYQLVESQVSYK